MLDFTCGKPDFTYSNLLTFIYSFFMGIGYIIWAL